MDLFSRKIKKLHGPEQNSVGLYATSVYVA